MRGIEGMHTEYWAVIGKERQYFRDEREEGIIIIIINFFGK